MDISSDPEQLLSDLSVWIYEEPLATAWRDRLSAPAVMQPLLLIIDMDTELNMQGLLGYLENSTGKLLPQTISALELVGAHETAEVLRNVQGIMARHSVTHESLQADMATLPQYSITTFAETHGERGQAFAKDLADVQLYVNREPRDEDPLAIAVRYIQENIGQIADALRSELSRSS